MGLKNSYPLRPSPTIPSSSSPSILNGIDYHHHHVDRKYAQVLQNINETRSTPSKTREPNGDTLKPFGTAVSDIITNTSGNKAGQNNHPNIPRSEGVKKSEHVTQKPHQCDQCHLKFTCAGNLNRHKRVTHEMKRILCQYPSCTQVCQNNVSFSVVVHK